MCHDIESVDSNLSVTDKQEYALKGGGIEKNLFENLNKT
jgi:hypothetical protein